MFKDQTDLLSAFNAHNVEYLVVGGHAVGEHSQPRGTKDLDILIRSDEANSKAVFLALADYGAPLAGISAEDFNNNRPPHPGPGRRVAAAEITFWQAGLE